MDCCEAELVMDCRDVVRVTRCREMLGAELWATTAETPAYEAAERTRLPHHRQVVGLISELGHPLSLTLSSPESHANSTLDSQILDRTAINIVLHVLTLWFAGQSFDLVPLCYLFRRIP